MVLRNFTTMVVCVLALAAHGCSSHHDPEPPVGYSVDAVLSAASLGEDCPDADADRADGDCAPGFDGCGSFCQQSNMQIGFTVTGEIESTMPVTVVEVAVLDAESLERLDTLAPRAPQRWDDGVYAPWDEQLGIGELGTSYKLSAPDWAGMRDDVWETYSMRFVLEVTLDIDGREHVLRSGELVRVADIDT